MGQAKQNPRARAYKGNTPEPAEGGPRIKAQKQPLRIGVIPDQRLDLQTAKMRKTQAGDRFLMGTRTYEVQADGSLRRVKG